MTKDVCIDASPVCSVRELGKTVEAILSSRKHPNLLQQLHDNVDSLQKSRYCPCAFHHDYAGQIHGCLVQTLFVAASVASMQSAWLQGRSKF